MELAELLGWTPERVHANLSMGRFAKIARCALDDINGNCTSDWKSVGSGRTLCSCDSERESYDRFQTDHVDKCPSYTSTLRENGYPIDDCPMDTYVVIIRGGSIGSDIYVRCNCGFEENITCYEHMP
jgi:hypothetical protein